jgi:RNA polymerase sigma-70 factor (ECF subfamily)
MYNEKELILALKAGDNEAFNHLYDKYSGALFNIIKQIIRDSLLAEDLLQEVFINVWRKIESYDPSKASLFTWMHNIARNASIGALKSEHQGNAHTKEPFKKSADPHPETGAMIRDIDYLGSGKTIAKLMSENYAVFDLSYFKGYTGRAGQID